MYCYDLEVINGKRDQLVGRIQERYGIAKDAAELQTDEFLKQFSETDAQPEKSTRSHAKIVVSESSP
jgi:hypothetical protein